MGHSRGMAIATAAGVMAWSPAALACGGSSAVALFSIGYALLMVFLLSLVAVGSMRAARQAMLRMLARRGSTGLRVATFMSTVLYVGSITTTILSGGLLLALVLIAV